MNTVSTKVLEALAWAMKAVNVAEITLEEVTKCIEAIQTRTSAENTFAASAPLMGACEDIVVKACERLAAE